jgi:signal transduction histidine kinase
MAPSTWRRWAHLILGGAIAVPFGTLGGSLGSLPVGMAVGVALALATGLLPAVRDVELAAARALLDVPTSDWRPGPWRGAAWFAAHLAAGCAVSILTLVALTQFPLALVGLVWVAAGAGALLARLAPVLLGPTPAERLAILAERNRIARELHDSVGHALGVVSIQAAAAERVLDSNPEFAREALRHIAASARAGQRDLDHVLGLLREEQSAPAPDLGDLDRLLDPHAVELSGDLRRVPGAVSREAYRIIQEGLTNAARHGDGAPTVRLAVSEDRVELELSNPVGTSRPGGGRGLRGIEERVATLRGRMAAGSEAGVWRLKVELPL